MSLSSVEYLECNCTSLVLTDLDNSVSLGQICGGSVPSAFSAGLCILNVKSVYNLPIGLAQALVVS